jgi:VWFA-related protein
VEALRQLFLTTVPGDEYFLIRFSDKASILSDFTPEPDDITSALTGIKARGWTALLDAVALGAHRMNSARNPRKALLILSDGGDNNSRYSEAEIRLRVMESDFRIYALGIAHRSPLLEQLAEETGGKMLVANTLPELPDVVRALSAEIRSQYVLEYRSPAENDGKYRRVKVELVQPTVPNLRLAWRRGYFSPDR